MGDDHRTKAVHYMPGGLGPWQPEPHAAPNETCQNLLRLTSSLGRVSGHCVERQIL